jgi:2-dehydropantoate 2-reductase
LNVKLCEAAAEAIPHGRDNRYTAPDKERHQMKILVMGAGAVGAYYGARLQQAGEEVVYCARGENLRALKENGLELESPRGDAKLKVVATDHPADFAPYDLILFAVKSYDSEPAARQLQGCLAKDGILMTIQNGVENEEVLCRFFPREAIMSGNSLVGADMREPGKLVQYMGGVIEFAELEGGETPRALRLAEIFKRAGILGGLSDDQKTIRWFKLMGNNSSNSITALCRRSLADVLNDPDGYALMYTLAAETVEVGRAEGARMSEDQIEPYLKRTRGFYGTRTSTLQDVEKGKPLEYEGISGAVIRAARRHGIKVPATEAVYTLQKLLDGSKNR